MSSRTSSSSDPRRMSINDVQLPSDLLKNLSRAVLKEIGKYDDPTFFEYFEGLKLNDVSEVSFACPNCVLFLYAT